VVDAGQRQESRLKPGGSTERLGYCEGARSVAVAVTVVIVAASEAVRLKVIPWDRSEAGDEEVAGICWTSSSRSEIRSTSMITGDSLSNIDAGSFDLSGSAGRIVIGRDDPKKESILG
jgi:hypothetical protein